MMVQTLSFALFFRTVEQEWDELDVQAPHLLRDK